MMELASRFGKGPVLVEDIASSQGISGKYIHVIAGGLRAAGMVRAVRGPSGGYELARHPSEVTALDVVRSVEGSLAPVDCVADACSCPRVDACAARDLWQEVASAVEEVLRRHTLADLVERQKAAQQGAASWDI